VNVNGVLNGETLKIAALATGLMSIVAQAETNRENT